MDISLQYKNFTAIIDTKGAELKSLKLTSGRELMWNANPFYWGRTSPVLFPMIGTLRDGKTIINGVEYAIPKHGIVRDCEFEYSQIAENDVTFTLNSTTEMLKNFPFQFQLKIHYRLLGDRVKMTYTVRNKSNIEMPYCIGGHPAFNCPFDAESKFSDYFLVFEKPETASTPIFNTEIMLFNDYERVPRISNSTFFPLNHNLFINDCIYFDKLVSKSALITRDRKTGVQLSWDGFETLAVWSPEGKSAPFVCLEPWCGSADFTTDNGIFTEKRGIQILEPNQAKKYSMVISEAV